MQLCPKCQTELRITKTYLEVSGDQSPLTPTTVIRKQDKTCKNRNCENYNQAVFTEENKIFESPKN